ncbi:DEAD/DEAH box helicase family protein [uncultured Cocleimonas sp.]|uniref:DEAD/DEAH box helicase n=1 Tax=uncultured Cocleimonas sp. TaxID=1051587 RepID=UPI0034586A0F
MSQLGLSKEPDLQHWLEIIQSQYPTVKAFEREFPSLCFAIATGVGKTRLMGAMISWLFLTGRSRNFFILAPNLTIYEKLKQDFTLGNTKYVFKGIAEFAQTPPTIITGEDYADGRGVRLEMSVPMSRSGDLFGSETEAHINIFNISKINARENKKGAKKSGVAKMRRLQEYIGDSYFNHLAELPDLVVLMDEAHRYYASAGAKAINELKPILGIELTATPKTVGTKPREFSNIIYHYPLSMALQDGYVKIPAVATRKDFNPKQYSSEQLEAIKLEDGIHHHEYVTVELQTHAHSTGGKAVKPFMLVVAQDTIHAGNLKTLIQSDDFFGGRYKDKVIEVHSKQTGEESDEAMARLLAVEHDEDTEIVIHVNKLKEGWDVTNLYTIVPLRASTSEILTEQTIGRGLRLPFGNRTGVDAIDRLTIIAHDRFQEILDRAKDEESIIRKTIYIGGDDSDVPNKKPKLIETPSVLDMVTTGKKATQDGQDIQDEPGDYQAESAIKTKQERKIAEITFQVIREETRKLSSSKELNTPQVQEDIARKVKHRILPTQNDLPGIGSDDNSQQAIAEVVKTVSENIIKLTIDIPQIVILPTREVNYGFSDFDLQSLEQINYQPVSQKILLQHLEGDQERDFIHFGDEQAQETRLEDYIVRNLMDLNEIDYDSHAELLYKLAGQLVSHLQSKWEDRDKIENVLIYYQCQLRDFIWAQMQQNLWSSPTDYQGKLIKGFEVLEPNVYTIAADEEPRDFRAPVKNKNSVKKMLFTGFQRCCYPFQKFDSVEGELAMAQILENDDSVLKWMKPASGKFKIEYQSGEKYEPDFVVETKNICLLIEPKRSDEVNDEIVQAKKRAAERWCSYANEHARQIGGKQWKYLLIPHNEILSNSSLEGLIARFG